MARTPILRELRRLFREQGAARACGLALRDWRERSAEQTFRRGVSRRDFLTGLAAASVASAFPHVARASGGPRIVIVGAGLAGLTCALTLADRGIRATVFEASSRVGGRVLSNTRYWDQGQISEWGGELIDTGHRTIRHLARRFNLPLDDLLAAQPPGSQDTYYLMGGYYTKAQADIDFAPVFDAVTADLDAAGYPTTFDQSTAAGRRLDHMSLYQWIETRVPGGHRSPMGQLLDLAYTIEYGAETTRQSALNLVYLLGFQPDSKGFAVFGESDERFHIRGGNQQLPRAIARHLGDSAFEMNHRLLRIKQSAAGDYELFFQTQDGTRRTLTDYVVLALPFSVLRHIDYSGANFDARKHRAIQELGRGRNAKTQLQFDTRLWQRQGPWPGISNGSSYSDSGFHSSWDVTRAQPGRAGIMNFYSGGAVTTAMQTSCAFATAANPGAYADALTTLERAEIIFPGLSAQWNGKATQSIPHLNPLMRASYAFYKPGQYTGFGGYEGARQGGVLFCGDHTTQDYQGFMEGAAFEGRRAARQLIRLL